MLACSLYGQLPGVVQLKYRAVTHIYITPQSIGVLDIKTEMEDPGPTDTQRAQSTGGYVGRETPSYDAPSFCRPLFKRKMFSVRDDMLTVSQTRHFS